MGHDMTDIILIVNAATGETVERERNAEEQAQYETDVAAAAAAEIEYQAAQVRLAAARAAAIEHAKGLGFTDEMIAVLYPNLGAPNE
jgi:ATPase subunit of ABC transporter with duplicated ATPase domains